MNSICDPLGITVADLKRIIADWPEINHLGEPTEVWLGTGVNLSGPCVDVTPLNCRVGTADLLLCPSDEAWNHSK